jgi:dTDP-glucose 4,6-dehydratase
MQNLAQVLDRPEMTFLRQDVSLSVDVPGPVDTIFHLASLASPRDYLEFPIETLHAGSLGTSNCLELARARRARFVMASTSEVYGDPLIHPQTEAYWGHVNPVGVRSVYDEAKRFSEAMVMAYRRAHGVEVKIARIFNTYGPRLRPHDGRVVSNLLAQALKGEPLTVYGDGTQTRSFCYVDDQIRGLLSLDKAEVVGPVNIGNPAEITILELVSKVLAITGSASPVMFGPLPLDDPARRQPDISLAKRLLGWEPVVSLTEGLRRTADWLAGQSGLLRQATGNLAKQ